MKIYISLFLLLLTVMPSCSKENLEVYYADSFIVHTEGVDFVNVSKKLKANGIKIEISDEQTSSRIKQHLAEMKLNDNSRVSGRIRSFVTELHADIHIMDSSNTIGFFKINLQGSRFWPINHKNRDKFLDGVIDGNPQIYSKD
jgi:hypothetical protein